MWSIGTVYGIKNQTVTPLKFYYALYYVCRSLFWLFIYNGILCTQSDKNNLNVLFKTGFSYHTKVIVCIVSLTVVDLSPTDDPILC